MPSPDLYSLLSKDTGIQKLANNLQEGAAGSLRGLTVDLAGGTVDLVNEMLRPIGLASENPVGGSKQLRELTGQPAQEQTTAGQLGNLLSSFAAPEKLPLALGIMMGPLSKTWNSEKADMAAEMLLKDADPKDVWAQTGNLLSPGDRMLRQEIPDLDSKFLKIPKTGSKEIGKEHGLTEVFQHDKLLEAYPEMASLKVVFDPTFSGGEYRRNQGKIILGTEPVKSRGSVTRAEVEMITNARIHSTLLHELQHAVQEREGFARGGNPDSEYKQLAEAYMQKFGKAADSIEDKKMAEDAMDNYRKLAGEAEARMVQARMNLHPKNLESYFPGENDGGMFAYDVPVDELISR